MVKLEPAQPEFSIQAFQTAQPLTSCRHLEPSIPVTRGALSQQVSLVFCVKARGLVAECFKRRSPNRENQLISREVVIRAAASSTCCTPSPRRGGCAAAFQESRWGEGSKTVRSVARSASNRRRCDAFPSSRGMRRLPGFEKRREEEGLGRETNMWAGNG